MLDRIPERLRTAAEGVEKATQMMADAKSKRNQAAGDVGANYQGLPKERTAEWQAADMIERYEAALKRIDYYYGLNDCDDMKPSDAIEIDVKALREIHQLLKSE
jgi:hypothetical protein